MNFLLLIFVPIKILFIQVTVDRQARTVESFDSYLSEITWHKITTQNMWNQPVDTSHNILNQLSLIHRDPANLNRIHRPIAHHKVGVIGQIIQILLIGGKLALQILWHILTVNREWISTLNQNSTFSYRRIPYQAAA